MEHQFRITLIDHFIERHVAFRDKVSFTTTAATDDDTLRCWLAHNSMEDDILLKHLVLLERGRPRIEQVQPS